MTAFLNAIRFLTIFPIPSKQMPETAEMGRSSAFFPLVGLFIGALLAIVYLLVSRIFPKDITSVFIIFVLFALTRGIHLDGLADTADAVWGGSDQRERQMIMKDSRIGTFGTCALFFILLLKFLLLNFLPAQTTAVALILTLTLSRWALTVTAFISKPSRTEGLGEAFVTHTTSRQFILATITTLIVALACFRLEALIPFAAILLFSLVFAFLISRSFGGTSGDSLGACAELSEILCLMTVLLLVRANLA